MITDFSVDELKQQRFTTFLKDVTVIQFYITAGIVVGLILSSFAYQTDFTEVVKQSVDFWFWIRVSLIANCGFCIYMNKKSHKKELDKMGIK